MQLFSRAEKFQAKHFDVVSQEAFPVLITNTVDDKILLMTRILILLMTRRRKRAKNMKRELWPVTKYLD